MSKRVSESKLVYSIPIIILILCIVATTFLVIYNSKNYYSVKQGNGEIVDYIIGVSQSQLRDPWQIRIYEEILSESKNHDNIKVIFTDAAGDSGKQIDDIDKLLEFGIDLLIVSPTNSESISFKVSDVYKKLPVIVLDRGVEGYDYSLYIGPDNSMVGKQVGEYISKILNGKKGKVVEITGTADSNATKERSLGFYNELEYQDNIEVIKVIGGEWNKDKAEDEMYNIFNNHKDIDIVFAHNDDMALGAYTAYVNSRYSRQVKFVSIDGLQGEFGGLDLVEKGIFQCTFTLPTGGKEALQYAIDILNKESGIPKKVILRSTRVDSNNIKEYKEKQKDKILINEKSEKITLGFCNVGKEGGWREANKVSIKNAAQEANIELIYAEADLDQKKQIEIIRGFIKMGVDIISFSPVVEDGWDEILKEAKEADIPVIIADRMISTEDKTLYTTFIGSDFTEEGRRAARWIVENMDTSKKINIVEIQGMKGTTPTIERNRGFEEVLLAYDNINIIRSKDGDFTFETGRNIMNEYLKSVNETGEEINVVFAHNDDMALGAIEAIQGSGLSSGKDIKIVSIDAIKAAIIAIKDGKMNCSIECNPLIGPQIMKLAKDIVNGKDSPMMMITEEDVFEEGNFNLEWLNRKY